MLIYKANMYCICSDKIVHVHCSLITACIVWPVIGKHNNGLNGTILMKTHEHTENVSKNYSVLWPNLSLFLFFFFSGCPSGCSVCIKGSLGVRDSQKLPWDFQKSMPGSLGLPTFKDI